MEITEAEADDNSDNADDESDDEIASVNTEGQFICIMQKMFFAKKDYINCSLYALCRK